MGQSFVKLLIVGELSLTMKQKNCGELKFRIKRKMFLLNSLMPSTGQTVYHT